MGVYRYWCETLHEVLWVLDHGELRSVLKRLGSEVTISFDQQVNMFCLSIREYEPVRDEDLPF